MVRTSMFAMALLYSAGVWCSEAETSPSSPTPTSPSSSWHYHTFNDAMRVHDFPRSIEVTKRIVGIEGADILALCSSLYEQNNPSVMPCDATPRIPKIIHQIWLGGPLPEEFKAYIYTWLEKHPGWYYKLWTDEDMKNIRLYNQQYYDEAENYGVKSDLLKWEVIYSFGGVYIDVDFECLQPLDRFHETYDFYTALQPLDTQFVQLGAAIFGAVPEHPILKHCIETIKDDWHLKGAPTKTGPVHFTKSLYAMAGKTEKRDIVFPAFYFYPLGCCGTQLDRSGWLQAGAYALHHWAKSWMPKEYRTDEFKNISNETSEKNWNM